jgi:hypothetical protein
MREVEVFLTALCAVVVLFGYVEWAVRDARRRHKSGFLVAAAVLLFFPLGLVAWLLFRPTMSNPQH